MLKLRSLLILSLCLLVACASLDNFDEPVVELAGIEMLPPEGFEQRLQLTLRVINPNDQDFTIEGIYSELSLQGKELVKGVSNQSVAVPAYGEAMIELEATASLIDTFQLFKKFILSPSASGVEYELASKVSIKNYKTVRVNKKGSFSLQR